MSYLQHNDMQWLVERYTTEPDRLAFIHSDKSYKYSDIVLLINEYKKYISNSTISPGDIIYVLGDYSPEIFCFLVALGLNNNIIVPITKNSVIEEDAMIKITGCDFKIIFSDNHSKPIFEIKK